MTTDFRAMCADLLKAWQVGDDIAGPMRRARAALAAEPVGEGPTDQDVLQELIDVADDALLSDHPGEVARAGRRLLARWGRPATPPAPVAVGEAAELAEELRIMATLDAADQLPRSANLLTRAADLLQQLSAPAPAVVPVAIPGEQWHEDDGACLWWRFEIDEPPWVGDPRDSDWPGYHTHFTRIVCPLPQAGEGEGEA